MTWTTRIRELLSARRTGFSLPQDFYCGQSAFEADLAGIFEAQWIFAANAAELPEPGDFLTLDIGRTSVLLVRDADNLVRGFFNTCRHRGSRICLAETGTTARLTCPYHRWVYGLDGTLERAPDMPGDFDGAEFGLRPVHVEIVCGLVYVCLADEPPDIEAVRATVTPYLAPHQPERTKVAAVSTMIENANWKLVIENNRECYHCEGSHPELLVSLLDFPVGDVKKADEAKLRILDAAQARWGQRGIAYTTAEVGRAFRCVRLPFKGGVRSMTLDGELGSKKLLGDLTDPDMGSVRMFFAPNNWHHFLSDHIIHFRVTPLAPDKTMVRTTWMVHEDAIEGWDYDPVRLREVWDKTNIQDRMLAENNHSGLSSKGYRPGPYSPTVEAGVVNFIEWYAQALERAASSAASEAAR
jgi:glycine betaine catabolism A